MTDFFSKLFDTKWKRLYEKHSEKIESMGYDAWINSPLDIMDRIIGDEMWKALEREAGAMASMPTYWRNW